MSSESKNARVSYLGPGGSSRPTFSSQVTSDRLREAERRPSTSSSLPPSSVKNPRKSKFREVGLDDQNVKPNPNLVREIETRDSLEKQVNIQRTVEEHEHKEDRSKRPGNTAWLSKLAKGSRPQIKHSSSAPPGAFSTMSRTALIVFLIALVVPGFRYGGKEKVNISGADAGLIRTPLTVENGHTIQGRDDSPTAVCTRWSQQSMIYLPVGIERRTDRLQLRM